MIKTNFFSFEIELSVFTREFGCNVKCIKLCFVTRCLRNVAVPPQEILTYILQTVH